MHQIQFWLGFWPRPYTLEELTTLPDRLRRGLTIPMLHTLRRLGLGVAHFLDFPHFLQFKHML